MLTSEGLKDSLTTSIMHRARGELPQSRVSTPNCFVKILTLTTQQLTPPSCSVMLTIDFVGLHHLSAHEPKAKLVVCHIIYCLDTYISWSPDLWWEPGAFGSQNSTKRLWAYNMATLGLPNIVVGKPEQSGIRSVRKRTLICCGILSISMCREGECKKT